MKHLNQFITEYIVKKKLDKFVDSEHNYKYFPETKKQLIDNIQELLEKGKTDLNCIDTSKITDMSYLFKNVRGINFDVSNWNVSNGKYLNSMFFECKKFKGNGIENWSVGKVKDMSSMFYNCTNFNCDLSNWDISNVKNMSFAFYNCKSLKNTPSWYKA